MTQPAVRWSNSLPAASLARALLLVAGLSVMGCRRAEPSRATPPLAAASPSAAPVAESASPSLPLAATKAAPARLSLRLEAPAANAGTTSRASSPLPQRVLLTSPELGLDVQVAELAFPNTCEAFAAESERPFRVTCTPRYRKPVAEAFERAGEVVLRLLPTNAAAREMHVPLGPGRSFDPVASAVSSRTTPCDPALKATRPVRVTLPSANWCCGYTPASILSLAVPGSPPLQLTDEHNWWTGCSATEQPNAVDIQCPHDSHHGRITLEGPSIRFEWQDKQRDAGRVLVPCDVLPVLVKPDRFSGGNMYR